MNLAAIEMEAKLVVERTLTDAFGGPVSTEQCDAIFSVGRTHYDAERFSEAADIFRLLALAEPGRARSWFSLAVTHDAAGDEDRARALYELACAVPADPEYRAAAGLYLARCHLREGDVWSAREKLAAVDDALFDETHRAELQELHVAVQGGGNRSCR
jgi:Flp pilus assembly protein TadD